MRNLKKFNFLEKDFCGACGISTGENDPFVFACIRHDKNYALLTVETPNWEELAKRADEQFLQDMFNIIKVTGRWWLYPRAYLYYRLSRFYGKKVIAGRERRN